MHTRWLSSSVASGSVHPLSDVHDTNIFGIQATLGLSRNMTSPNHANHAI